MDYKSFFTDITSILNSENKKCIIEECLQHILSLTGTEENKKAILDQHDLIETLVKLTTPVNYDSKRVSNLKYLAETLINLSADEQGAKKVLHIECRSCDKNTLQWNIIENCFKHILNQENELADMYCKLLCNLTRTTELINHVINYITENKMNQLVEAFSNLVYNNKECNLDYLAPFFANVTQTNIGVDFLFKPLSQLLKFITNVNSLTRRYGIVAMIKNIIMKYSTHEFILNKNSNVLPNILVLLVNLESKSEMLKYLSEEFQILLATSVKESDTDITLMLLEILLKLCNSPEGRELMRGQGVYEILREFHKHENNERIIYLCETVVNILIRTEDELGATHLDHLAEETETLDKK